MHKNGCEILIRLHPRTNLPAEPGESLVVGRDILLQIVHESSGGSMKVYTFSLIAELNIWHNLSVWRRIVIQCNKSGGKNRKA